jgi:uncharacterized protein with HEPN domain
MKDTKQLIKDMEDAVASIKSYSPTNYDDFVDDVRTQDAIMFNLVVLGEAANKIPGDFREKHPEIPWSSIIGTRNVIVHGYDQVKLHLIWDIISKDLGKLHDNLRKIST